MISPSSGKTSVTQLNMGEGKSSIIVPIVAATLADGKILAGVVVLKPLMKQMFHTLTSKIGGLLGRRVYQIPISRDWRADSRKCTLTRKLYDECQQNGGVLYVQPEHLLSFELMGLDQLLAGQTQLGYDLVRMQQSLNLTSWDILDESDEILSVRSKLIYTMGTQKDLEFSAHRWMIVQHILKLTNKYVKDVASNSGHDIEVRPVCSGSKLNRIRLLHDKAGHELVTLIAHDICDSGLPGLSVWKLHMEAKANFCSF